ncbi:MAG: insulinase family protein [Lachnospiraceae bacterium]|nr:insulinase family protein [Lachnospiraceae bacterium]
MKIEDVKEYEVIKKQDIKDLRSKGYLLRHKKSGARICILQNDDRNKVFYTAFRTPPSDSCGTPHILEHTVLCGSKKYRAKDPFIELAKGSLNTFLNAMTYPDKTVFPVASTNDTDFKNLSDVYMDAVLHPNIYENEKIFRQEGWHYELDAPDGELTYNGVVYNEMKGAFSSPDDVLERFVFNSLYPDTAYALESGGDPDDIPDLTYERFLELHKKYYHPSNSYIYIYGNCDMAERLKWLDREYLSEYGKEEIDSKIRKQKPFSSMLRTEKKYSLSDSEDLSDNTYLSLNYVTDGDLDPKLKVSFQILQYALLESQGAPLKQAVLDAGICKDVESVYEGGILQPYFSIVAKYSDEKHSDTFIKIINEKITELIKNGIDRQSLLAGLNIFEFKYREADFGNYPKGLMYGLECLDSWLYDDSDPFSHIELNGVFEALRAEIESDSRYFEKILERFFVKNTHSSFVMLKPEKGLSTRKEEETAKKLAKLKEKLSPEETARIIKETKELKEYQSGPSTQEELKTIPILDIKDIEKQALPIKNDEKRVDGSIFLHHDIYTNGIAYIGLMFSMQSIPEELVTAVGLLKSVLGAVNTKEHTYKELNNLVNIETGGLSFETAFYSCSESFRDFDEEFEIRVRVKEDRIGKAFDLIREILFDSDFSDKKRLKELVGIMKSRAQSVMQSSGHVVSSTRALSYISDQMYYNDKLSGIEFYRYVDELERDFENRIDKAVKDMKKVLEILLHGDNLMTDVTSSKKAFDETVKSTLELKKLLSKKASVPAKIRFARHKANEGFRSPGQVQYVAKAGNFFEKGLPYRGELRVLKVIMGYDYLWNNVRVLGGAYGCMSGFSRNGNMFFVSYRDPHLKHTLKVFDEAAEFVKKFKVSKRDMNKFIIGTISDLDTPLTPKAEGLRSLGAYMSRVTFEELQEERDSILSCSQKSIRELAQYLELTMKDDVICVVGSEEKIDENSKLFGEVRNLL